MWKLEADREVHLEVNLDPDINLPERPACFDLAASTVVPCALLRGNIALSRKCQPCVVSPERHSTMYSQLAGGLPS